MEAQAARVSVSALSLPITFPAPCAIHLLPQVNGLTFCWALPSAKRQVCSASFWLWSFCSPL